MIVEELIISVIKFARDVWLGIRIAILNLVIIRCISVTIKIIYVLTFVHFVIVSAKMYLIIL